MEIKILNRLSDCLKNEQPVALVTVIATTGSAPGKPGAMMVVEEDGTTTGTVGGGNLEHQITAEALASIRLGQNKEVHYDLSTNKELAMVCGGTVRAFIKYFEAAPKLIIVGAGHIGMELYNLAMLQGFRVVVVDIRQELASAERFPQATRLVGDDIAAALKNYPINSDCYVTIATASHDLDQYALEAVVESDARYIGMIGSTAKIRKIFKYLLAQNISLSEIEKVYAPMGLNIASIRPREIALAIFSEILLVKNNGSRESMRQIKKNLLPQ